MYVKRVERWTRLEYVKALLHCRDIAMIRKDYELASKIEKKLAKKYPVEAA